jgi:hypothetical protein
MILHDTMIVLTFLHRRNGFGLFCGLWYNGCCGKTNVTYEAKKTTLQILFINSFNLSKKNFFCLICVKYLILYKILLS